MSVDQIVNSVRSASTHVLGRTLNSTRNHHYIIDGTTEPKEEVTPVEVFLSAVSACGVQWVEKFAREEGVGLDRVTADIEGTRHSDQPERFQYVEMKFEIVGPSQSEAERYVEQFKGRCPLYRTLASATEVRFEVQARPS
jgi:uncharacterized OsmC-like protein